MKIIVSLTTIPANIPRIQKTLESLLTQTIKPNKIIVNIPNSHNKNFDTKELNKLIEINRCNDYGQSTKILGLLKYKFNDDDIIITVDDTIGYPKKMIETYCKLKDNKDNIYCLLGRNTFDNKQISKKYETNEIISGKMMRVEYFESFGSVMIRGHMLNANLLTIVHFPKYVKYSDDLFLSNFMQYKKYMIETNDFSENKLILPTGKNNKDLRITNFKTLAFFIKKGLCNFNIEDRAKKNILCNAMNKKYLDEYDALSIYDVQYALDNDHNIDNLSNNKKDKIILIFPHVINYEGHGCQTRVMQILLFLIKYFVVHIISAKDIKGHEWNNQSIINLKKIDKSITIDLTQKNNFIDFTKNKLKTLDFKYCFVNYNYKFDDVVPKSKLICELHDNSNLIKILRTKLLENPDDFILSRIRNYYAQIRNIDNINSFSKIICNSEVEESYINNLTYYIPNSVDISVKNTYSGLPIFVASNNIFNIHGLKLLVKQLNFKINLIGKICSVNGIENTYLNKLGFIDSLESIYVNAPYSICPLVMGTGSKVKIAESLCAGVPVVAMIDSGISSPIIHGYNGFLCNTLEELIKYCEILNKDNNLCKIMGKNAKRCSKNKITYEKVFDNQ